MNKRIKIGPNRTGIAASPIDSQALLQGVAEQATTPSPELGPDRLREPYGRDDGTLGSMPPPLSLKGVVGAVVEGLSGQRLHVLLDKLGERAAYERTGTRLYDAMLRKVELADQLPYGMTPDAVREIRDDEAAHFRLVSEAITALGGDPTVQTPCANVAGVQGLGLVQAINEPRATLAQALQTLLAAELIDEASWELLIDLCREYGHGEWATRFEAALAHENAHVVRVRRWLVEATEAEASTGT